MSTPVRCPCCDGYGQRPRPPHLPGEGPLACVSCHGTGLVWRYELAPPTYVAPTVPTFDPWLTQPPFTSPTITWRIGGEPMPAGDQFYMVGS